MITIIDFGSQYTQLICRRIRELKVKAEIVPYNSVDVKNLKNSDGIVLSGSPFSVNKNLISSAKDIFNLDIPILGICFGMQLIAKIFNGELKKAKKTEFGETQINIVRENELFREVPRKTVVWMSHFDTVYRLPPGFNTIARTNNIEVAAFENKNKKIYGVQFHPEVSHTKFGKKIIENFAFKICKSKKDWDIGKWIDEEVKKIKEEVRKGKVIMALSGGVDSSVAAVLINQAISNRLISVFVNHGLIRDKDLEKIKILKEKLGMSVKIINAEKEFLFRLKGVINPEKKRKIIGREFINVFKKYSYKIKGITHLGQGTLYPDVIESAKIGSGSSKIKSHHNVGGLPKNLSFKLIEPLKFLFKDEVRIVGKKLGIPEEIINDHPFPGPGLAVRIIGEINKQRVDVLRKSEKIVEEELKKINIYYEIWQAFPVLLPVKTVGVMGDRRTYENVIAIRCVNSNDGMTANWVKLPYNVLSKISSRIVNEVKGVNRVVYDLTNKPPGTIEWE